MLSALPNPLSSDHLFGSNHFSAFGGGFTPWEGPDRQLIFKPKKDNINITSNAKFAGSDDANKTQINASNPGSDGPNRNLDDRKKRRKISNRESARRSRMRRQKHLEILTNLVNRFRIENRQVSARLRFIQYHSHRIRTENDRLRSEHMMLRQKLSAISQLLAIQQLQYSACASWTSTPPIDP